MNARILVVEDESIVAADIRGALVKQGYDVLKPVASGSQAIHAAKTLRPALVLMSMKLKGDMDGVEAARVVREQLRIPVLILTSHSDEATLDRETDALAYGYLLRPFEDRELCMAVRFALARHDLEARVRENDARLRRSEYLYRTLARQLPDSSVTLFDPDLKVILTEGSSAEFGREGQPLEDVAPCSADRTQIGLWRAALEGVESTYEAERDGRSLRVDIVPVRDEEETIFAGMLMIRDVTAQKRDSVRLAALTVTDDLTGLHNRRGFVSLAAQHAHAAARNQEPFAVLFLDVDGLKQINDVLGHELGDQALCDAASALSTTMRAADIVGRLGGDEFVVLLAGATAREIDAVLDRLDRAFATRSKGRPYELSVSIGEAVSEASNRRSIDAMLAEADRRMYANKKSRASRRPSMIVHAGSPPPSGVADHTADFTKDARTDRAELRVRSVAR